MWFHKWCRNLGAWGGWPGTRLNVFISIRFRIYFYTQTGFALLNNDAYINKAKVIIIWATTKQKKIVLKTIIQHRQTQININIISELKVEKLCSFKVVVLCSNWKNGARNLTNVHNVKNEEAQRVQRYSHKDDVLIKCIVSMGGDKSMYLSEGVSGLVNEGSSCRVEMLKLRFIRMNDLGDRK